MQLFNSEHSCRTDRGQKSDGPHNEIDYNCLKCDLGVHILLNLNAYWKLKCILNGLPWQRCVLSWVLLVKCCSFTDIGGADSSGVVDLKAAPSLARCSHAFNILSASMVQSTEVRERIGALLRWYSRQIIRSHAWKIGVGSFTDGDARVKRSAINISPFVVTILFDLMGLQNFELQSLLEDFGIHFWQNFAVMESPSVRN